MGGRAARQKGESVDAAGIGLVDDLIILTVECAILYEVSVVLHDQSDVGVVTVVFVCGVLWKIFRWW